VHNEAGALRANLSISRPAGAPEVLVLSALEGSGVQTLWETLARKQVELGQGGALAARRRAQRRAWFASELESALRDAFAHRPDLLQARQEAEQSVESGAVSPTEAVQRLLSRLLR